MAFDSLKKLHQDELYSNVVHLGNLLMTVIERKSNFFNSYQQYQTAVYYAHGLYEIGQFKKAGQIYYKALSFLKNHPLLVPSAIPSASMNSGGGGGGGGKNQRSLTTTISNSSSSSSSSSTSTAAKFSQAESSQEMTPENEVRYRLHLCLVKQSKWKEAVGVLDCIPTSSRMPKVNAALGELHRKLNGLQQTKQCYTDLLASSPFALEAAVELLQMGVPMDELMRVAGVVDIEQWSNMLQADEWLESWLVGHATLARRDYMAAANMFRDLDTKSMLANNSRLLSQLAKSYYNAGEYSKAIMVYQRVHSLDPLFLDGMDVLASLLAEDKTRTKELESLATQLMSSNPESPSAWVAMGYLCKAMKKYPKALYFAHRACGDAQAAYVEAMLLKGGVLLESKKWSEGALHFHEALMANPHRFELYEGMVNCQLEQHKMKDARMTAGYAIKRIGKNARTITLYASVLSRDQSTIGEAQRILEQAVSAAPYLLKAVYLLVDIYDKQAKYDRAVDLLRRQTSTHVKNRLHRLLGDFLSKADRPNEAMDSYRFALYLEPGDAHAEAGLLELGENLRADSIFLDLDSIFLPSTSGTNTKTSSETNTTTGGRDGGTSTGDSTRANRSSTPDIAAAGSSNMITPANASSSGHGGNSLMTNAPRRRVSQASTAPMGGPSTSTMTSPPRLVVLEPATVTPLGDNDADVGTAPVVDFDDDDMLSGNDDSVPFGDGGSDVY